jgi:hypothetical protein
MTIPAPADTMIRPEALAELARLRTAFPTHLIGAETIVGRGVRYLARARQYDTQPHTVITSDLSELRAALEARQPQGDEAHEPHAQSRPLA